MQQNDQNSSLLNLMARLSELEREVSALASRDKRAALAVAAAKSRLTALLQGFHRDKYKSTDMRKAIGALAAEILIFEKLGYDIGDHGAYFLLGVAALLDGRNQAAAENFRLFVERAPVGDRNLANAHYLLAMIGFNRRDFHGGIEQFERVFQLSPEAARDWQCKIYVGELSHFLRQPQEQLERVFQEIEHGLRALEGTPQYSFLRATLYLKWANCYVGTVSLDPKQPNALVNNHRAISLYKQARKCLPKHPEPDSLLPVVVDHSLAQALLLAQSVDMELAMTPSEMFASVFRRLRRIVRNKREEVILAQCYLMLGTCAVFSSEVSKDAGEIYLEQSRLQTANVPSDVCFYSPITKELLSGDEFVGQIDFFAKQLERPNQRR
jgi:tetratricopeptide (TPR) repeat protein